MFLILSLSPIGSTSLEHFAFKKWGQAPYVDPIPEKSVGSIDPMDPWLRGPCCIVTVFGYKSEVRTSNLQTETAVEHLQHHPCLRGPWPPGSASAVKLCWSCMPYCLWLLACMANMSLNDPPGDEEERCIVTTWTALEARTTIFSETILFCCQINGYNNIMHWT